jgi:hypothetical protein
MRGENQVGWAPRVAVGALALAGMLVMTAEAHAGSSEAPSCRSEAVVAAEEPFGVCEEAPVEMQWEGLGGMWIQMDRNGELVAPDAEGKMPASLSRLLSQNSRGLRVEARKSGRISMALNGRFLRAIVAHVDENGRVVTSCDPDLPEGHAHAAPSAGAPATSGKEE